MGRLSADGRQEDQSQRQSIKSHGFPDLPANLVYPMTARTSLTHPLRIHEVRCGPKGGGLIGITFCPGKRGPSFYGPAWQRDLEIDLDAVKEWGAQAVLTLTEEHELLELGVPNLGERVRFRRIDWHHLPIVDLNAPAAPFEAGWLGSGPAVLKMLRQGGKVMVHCRGGIGRAGTVAVCLLVELGVTPGEALKRVRQARPGAVETAAQERYLSAYTARLAPGILDQ